MVATREVELQGEGVVKHSFKLKHMEKWMAEGNTVVCAYVILVAAGKGCNTGVAKEEVEEGQLCVRR